MIFSNPEITQDEKTKKEVIELNAWVDGTLEIAKERTKEMFNRFWNNPNATPQQIADVYGNQAILLFQKLGLWQETIKQIDNTYEVLTIPEKWEVELNQDGTVNITEKVEPEPDENNNP
jgi:hypothetical protein